MPAAVISVDTARGDIATVFHFDASKSTDKEDPAASLQAGWNFGDGGPAYSPFTTTKTITHTYENTGVYYAKLVVKDTQGLSDTASKMIVIVNNLSNRPPNKPVYISPGNYSTGIKDSVNLKWLCTDPENDLLSYDIFIGYNANILYLKTSNATLNEYDVRAMEKKTNYFWQIAAHDPNGNYVLGDVWKFTTAP
jgi:PKD repeat protein